MQKIILTILAAFLISSCGTIAHIKTETFVSAEYSYTSCEASYKSTKENKGFDIGVCGSHTKVDSTIINTDVLEKAIDILPEVLPALIK